MPQYTTPSTVTTNGEKVSIHSEPLQHVFSSLAVVNRVGNAHTCTLCIGIMISDPDIIKQIKLQ